MKTFILNSINRLKDFSQNLDAESTLYSKSWEVFNETGDKELFIFRPNNELLISRNGIVQKGKWELLNIATLLIDVADRSYLLNAAYIEDRFLALKLDGTDEYMVMIETDMKDRFSLNTIGSIEKYLDDRYKRIEQERIDAEQERKKKEVAEQKRLEAIREAEIQREKKEEEERQRERKERERIEDLELKERIRRNKEENEQRFEYLKGAEKRYRKYKLWFNVLLIPTIVSIIFVVFTLCWSGFFTDHYHYYTDDTIFMWIYLISLVIGMVGIAKLPQLKEDYNRADAEMDEYERKKKHYKTLSQ